MKPGFPKKITTKKLGRGRYKILREDGYNIEVYRCGTYWWQVGNFVRRYSLKSFQYDLRNGFTAHDQLETLDTGA